jgi:hypothetical protein
MRNREENGFALTGDTSSCTAKFVFATELLELTNSMKLNPWEANSASASQEIPRILRNPKIHYRIQKHRAPAPILSQVNPVRASPSYLLMIHFDIILPSTHMSSQWALSIYVLPPKPCVSSPVPHT